MLTELNSGNKKTVEHVRVHLLPYLGGNATLDALRSDEPDDPACTICYTDVSTADGLTTLRNSLSTSQIDAYDKVGVCYVRLTELIMEALPKSNDGVWLSPLKEVPPFEQVKAMMESIFSSFKPSVCP
eukprot:CAMPEP_0184487704 /NCGR_PEP_ID=MMETSP0113_2-20130426/10283_1 /TAXON_ID=91329 /ORGANISM="Norrisiella sphaerica, Strain BC52" /LENGTH=127 /DNA_ID=CAMNT_0026870089 /DNA_START=183 /DNA_END=566 /DNA_ORIENTATION=+